MVKYILPILLAGALSAQAFDYLVYNTNSSPVAFQPVGPVFRSVSVLPARPPNHGVLIYSDNPATSNWNRALPNLALNWTKVSNNIVVPITQVESNSIITAQVNANSNALAQAQIDSKNTATNYFDTLDEATKRVLRALAEVTRQAVNTNRIADGFPAITVLQWRTRVMEEINAQPNTQ